MSLELFTRVASKIRIPRKKGGCWEWNGAHIPLGYGSVGAYNGKSQAGAHRVVYEMFVGEIPPDLELDHLCKNKGCCNPDHLEAVTARENQRRSNSVSGINMRKTHCLNGHAFDKANTHIKSGMRVCRACERDRMRRYYQQNPEKFRRRSRLYAAAQRKKKAGK